MMPAFQCACTPVSHRKALTSGTPGPGVRLPTGKLESQPRARMRISSSATAGTASGRIEVRY